MNEEDINCLKDIINHMKKDKMFGIKYLKTLMKCDNIICDRPLQAIHGYTMLSNRLDILPIYIGSNKIEYNANMNEYIFTGLPGNRLIFGNHSLPYIYYNTPIPFTFPIYKNDMITLLQSNVYYYEVTIKDNININYTWSTQCISVGFANKNTPINSHVGWYNNSIGFHSDDGTIQINAAEQDSNSKQISRKWKVGDTVGAGLIYRNKTIVQPFFTLNGKIIYMKNDLVKMSMPYFPCIGYDYPNSIEVNFSTKPFLFNIEEIITKNSNIVISSNNDFYESNQNIAPNISNVNIINITKYDWGTMYIVDKII
jgi:hypothetical protein